MFTPYLCQDCFEELVQERGCELCFPYQSTPCSNCPLPLSARDVRSDTFICSVYTRINYGRSVKPRLSRLWSEVKNHSWDRSQVGRGYQWWENGKQPMERPDVRAVRMPIDTLASRLIKLGLPFDYDITQSNVEVLARFKAALPSDARLDDYCQVCDSCAAVGRGAYGWSWAQRDGELLSIGPCHVDVDIPERPSEWKELIEAPLGTATWRPFLDMVKKARADLAKEKQSAEQEERTEETSPPREFTQVLLPDWPPPTTQPRQLPLTF